jgi:hypothetical protein
VEGAIRGRAATFDRLSEAAQRCGDSETRSVCSSRRLKGKLANLAGSRQAQPLGTVDVGVSCSLPRCVPPLSHLKATQQDK